MAREQFTVVFSTFLAWEAHLAQNALAQEGIESFIDDENVVAANFLYATAVGGIRLRVRSQDAERAAAIIDRMGKGQDR